MSRWWNTVRFWLLVLSHLPRAFRDLCLVLCQIPLLILPQQLFRRKQNEIFPTRAVPAVRIPTALIDLMSVCSMHAFPSRVHVLFTFHDKTIVWTPILTALEKKELDKRRSPRQAGVAGQWLMVGHATYFALREPNYGSIGATMWLCACARERRLVW